jgi:hypothetical protein
MLYTIQHFPQTQFLHLLAKHFLEGLPDQYIVGFVLIKYIKQQSG